MAKRYQVSVLDLSTKEFVEKKNFENYSDAEEFKRKTLEKDSHLVVGINDTLAKPEDSVVDKAVEKNDVDEQPKAKIINVKTKSSYIEIDRENKTWKITSSKLSRPLTTDSVVKATGYLTRIAKRLDLSGAASILEHVKNVGKFIIAGDTYGPDPSKGNAYTSPLTREPVSSITGPGSYEVFCDTCNLIMVPDKKNEGEEIRNQYVCPSCQWTADMEGVQEPSLTSDPSSFPLNGPTDYEKGGNAFLNSATYHGDGFTVRAVDEEKKEKKKERESGLDSAQRGAINTKLADATDTVREYLVTVQVIQQEVKNYHTELSEALGIKELKKQADLMEPAIKEMLDSLAEHEKQVQGVEYRLKFAYKKTNVRSKEEVEKIIKEIEKLVAPSNIKEFEVLRDGLYKETPVREQFSAELAKQSPEIDADIEEVKKAIELLKTKEPLPKEELKKIEEQEAKTEETSGSGKSSAFIDSRIDALVTATIIDEEVAKGMKESYKKDPKSIRKQLRKLEEKVTTPAGAPEAKEEGAPKEGEEKASEAKEGSDEVKEYSYRTFIKDAKGVAKENGGTGGIPKDTKVFINGIQDDMISFSFGGESFIGKKYFMEKMTKKASVIVTADLTDKLAKYWDEVKNFFKETIKPFTNFVTIANSEWKELNEKLDETFGNMEESEEIVPTTKQSSLNKKASDETPILIIHLKNADQNKRQEIENKLTEYENQKMILSWGETGTGSLDQSEVEYTVEPEIVNEGSLENTKNMLIHGLRTKLKETEFFVKEASLNMLAADDEIEFEEDKDAAKKWNAESNIWDQNGYAEVFEYLDELRESGETNMYGARSYIVGEFDVESKIAAKLLTLWMEYFGDGSKSAEERAKEAFTVNQGDLFKGATTGLNKKTSLDISAAKVSVAKKTKEDEPVTIKVQIGSGESDEEIMEKLRASDDTMDDIQDINIDEDYGILYIKMITTDSDEALDIINGALGL